MTRHPHYPLVLLPAPLLAALESTPVLPTFGLPQPHEDAFPPEIRPGKSLLAAIYEFIGLKKNAEELLAPERQAARAKYQAALREYEQGKAVFEAAEQAKVTPEVLRAHRRRKIAALLESSAVDSPGESTAFAGRSEAHFHEYLIQHFPGRILRRRMLGSGRAAYHPDFLYFDPSHRLRIDIELDEPYGLGHKLPIHFIDGDTLTSEDDQRDQAFLAAGWPVVRFSEQQVVEDPDGCAKVIADLVARLTGVKTPSLAETLPVNPQPRWTRETANILASQDFRATLTATLKPKTEKPTPKPSKPFQPSEYQQRIFEFLEHGEGHGLVTAVAGSGKSTTLLEAVKVIKGKNHRARIALLAFNRSISSELQAKLEEAGIKGVTNKTLNGFGRSILHAHRADPQVQRNKAAAMLSKAADDLWRRRLTKDEQTAASSLYGKFQSYLHLNPENEAHYEQLVKQYRIKDAAPLRPVIIRALEINTQMYLSRNMISLDDQNYLPMKLGLTVRPYDFVFVDECQDLTQTQLEMVRRAAGESGRLLFVGDARQAIMGFRGADNNSVQNIRTMPNPPTELRLTVSYRCPKSHVAKAKKLMPELEYAPGAKEGEIHQVSWAAAFSHVRERDLMFARYNNKVDLILLELLARGFTIDYEDVRPRANPTPDEQEQAFEADSGRPKAVVTELRKQAATFQPDQAPRQKPVVAKGEKNPLSVLTLWVLGRLYEQAQKWDAGSFLEFVTKVTDPDPRLGVRVSSAHQAKGLEAERVFIMGYADFGEARDDRQDWENEQEVNLEYVALTRAKDVLFLVGQP